MMKLQVNVHKGLFKGDFASSDFVLGLSALKIVSPQFGNLKLN